MGTTTYWYHEASGTLMRTHTDKMARACAGSNYTPISSAEYTQRMARFVCAIHAQREEGFTLFNLNYARALEEARARKESQ